MDVAAMLGGMLGGSWAMGMLMHLINGSVISSWGIILWFLSQAVVTPMMGGGLFSAAAGGLMAVMASLVGHLIYGAVLGVVAGGAAAAPAGAPTRAIA